MCSTALRALAVFGVLWFHFWQQNWIMPYIDLPFLARLGLPGTLSLLFIPRAGFLLVDWLLFLSAFCLFLPYARAALEHDKLPDAKLFYKKRVARIVPSYLVSVVLIFFCVSVPTGAYRTVWEALKDLLPTLTFTQTFFPDVLIGTKINGVLWTAAIEMQFYLFFPLLATAFSKKPVWMYLGMLGIAALYLRGFALPRPDSIRLTVNQLPAFFGVFANGMAFAFLFALAGKHHQEKPAALRARVGRVDCRLCAIAVHDDGSAGHEPRPDLAGEEPLLAFDGVRADYRLRRADVFRRALAVFQCVDAVSLGDFV